MICPECLHINDDRFRKCAGCGKNLPEPIKTLPRFNQGFEILKEQCDKVLKREVAFGDFRAFLKRTSEHYRVLFNDMETMDIPADYMNEMQDELRMGKGGIKLYLEAIAEMSRYPETLDEGNIRRGLLLAQNANDRLNEAVRMNQESYRTLIKTAEEFLSTQLKSI